jgi:NAD(P)H-nitrite reductase large subunit
VKVEAVSIERLLSAARSKQLNHYLEANMATVTDTDIQQLKDLITAGQMATQKQIAEIDKRIEVGLGKVETEIKGIHTELTDIKTNQRAQDNRFFGLIFFILTTAIGISAKLAKLY